MRLGDGHVVYIGQIKGSIIYSNAMASVKPTILYSM